MAILDGVGHGTTLAGRYRLDQPLHPGGASEVWRAVDTALDRPVAVRFVARAAAADALDAARRTSLVEDPRLLRVLDVGSHETDDAPGIGYVVSELARGEMLTSRLQHGPLPASVMRRVVGEAAEALERARLAGLHHARLTPASLVLTPDGAVKVAGLAVDAAVDGDPDGGEEAARADAVALVAVLYAGLTARWPMGEGAGLPPAPLVGGQPVPPADLVPGVPNDLDTLCAVTFGPHEDGPRTPGELAEQLAPWGKRPPEEERRSEAVEMRPPSRFPVRLAGTASAVGSAAAAAATAAGIRGEQGVERGASTGRLFTAARERDPHETTTERRPVQPPQPPAAPVPPPAEGPAPPPSQGGRQAGIVLGIVAALVIIGLAFAVDSLTELSDELPEPAATQPAAAPVAEPAPSAAASPAPTTQSPSPTTAPPQIQGVRTLDPQGDDGTENDEQAPLAIDGDAGTAWTSSTYSNAAFGNLKDGLGMVVDLGRPSTLSGVQLLVDGTGGEVEVRTSSAPEVEGSEVVGTAAIGEDPVVVELSEPVETRYVVLWFTELPEVGGDHRIELAEVEVR